MGGAASTKVGFSARANSRNTIEKMKLRLRAEPLLMVTTMWSETFKLPQSDERLLSLTPHEALEQVLALEALASIRNEGAERARKQRDMLDDKPVEIEREVITGAQGEAVADKPHLTGDPEWDEIELLETDPSRPLLDEG
jgi:hypothetical protein